MVSAEGLKTRLKIGAAIAVVGLLGVLQYRNCMCESPMGRQGASRGDQYANNYETRGPSAGKAAPTPLNPSSNRKMFHETLGATLAYEFPRSLLDCMDVPMASNMAQSVKSNSKTELSETIRKDVEDEVARLVGMGKRRSACEDVAKEAPELVKMLSSSSCTQLSMMEFDVMVPSGPPALLKAIPDGERIESYQSIIRHVSSLGYAYLDDSFGEDIGFSMKQYKAAFAYSAAITNKSESGPDAACVARNTYLNTLLANSMHGLDGILRSDPAQAERILSGLPENMRDELLGNFFQSCLVSDDGGGDIASLSNLFSSLSPMNRMLLLRKIGEADTQTIYPEELSSRIESLLASDPDPSLKDALRKYAVDVKADADEQRMMSDNEGSIGDGAEDIGESEENVIEEKNDESDV